LDRAVYGRGFEVEGLEVRRVLSALPIQAELQDILRNSANQADALLDSVDTLHDKIFDNVLTQNLPFLGDALAGPKNSSDDLLKDLRGKVDAVFTNLAAIADIDSTDVEIALEAALGSIMPDDLVPQVNVTDTDSDGEADTITLDVHLRDDLINASFSPAFDLGIDGLGLDVSGNVNVTLTYDFHFVFGASVAGGFFLDLSPTGATPEFKLDLKVTTPGLSATGSLAFLQLDVEDDAADPTSFEASFLVDLTDGPDAGSTLSLPSELAQLSLSASLTGAADLNFKGTVSFGGSAVFPSLVADLNVDWSFNSAGVTAGGGLGSFGSEPTVAFNNVGIDVGTFFDRFVSPIVEEVRDILEPVQPVIDVLTTRMPVLSDIGFLRDVYDDDSDGTVTLLEVVRKLSDNPALKFIDTVIEINNLVSKIPAGVGGGTILSLGSFSLNDNVGSDIRGLADFTGVDLTSFTPDNVAAQLSAIGASIGGDLGAKVGSFLGNIADDAFNEVPASRGLEFPLLERPETAMKLLLGQDVELFTFDAPRLGFDFHFDEFFRVLGPFGVRLVGDFSAGAKFAFGYDTNGIRQFADGGFSDPLVIFDGFYVSDTDQPDGSGTNDVAELQLSASIQAFAGVDIVVAAAGVGGGIFANVNLNLHDPDADDDADPATFGDGKVRISEIIERFDHGPLCLFDMSGTLTAALSAYVRIGVDVPFVGFVGWEDTFEIASATLLDFTFGCLPDPSAPDPILATDIGGGVLRLNMGPNAAARAHRDTTDADESFVVKHVGGDAANETVTVSAFGYTQTFSGVSKIYAEGGLGNDIIELQAGVLATSELYGDFKDPPLAGSFGDDQITAGEGAALLHGNAGNDQLTARTTGSEIHGDDGDDTVFGSLGNDTVRGGKGKDKLNGADGEDDLDGGDDNDIIDAGSGADTLTGGLGDDQLRGRAGADVLSGNAGNDVLVGGADADSLTGADGLDYLIGDDGEITFDVDPVTLLPTNAAVSLASGGANDTLRGDAGADALYGQDGDDDLAGGTENDYIDAGAGNDTALGDAGDDSILGGAGADLLSGNDGSDTIQGQAGNDTINGNAGNDSLLGGDNDDLISGGTGNDTINGNDGADSMTGDDDADLMAGDAGNDTMSGNAGNDTMSGGDNDDSMFGNAGDDSISGDAGDDDILGNSGADTISGGDGQDAILGDDGTITASASLIPETASALRALAPASLTDGGNDQISGDAGQDVIYAQGGADTVSGGSGDDTVEGNAGDDSVTGDAGDDDLIGGSSTPGTPDGADTIDGGAGHDVIAGDNASITRTALPDNTYDRYTPGLTPGTGKGAENNAPVRTVTPLDLDTVGGADLLSGGADDDSMYGGLGNDTMAGNDGNDDMTGHLGDDSMDGGAGSDALLGDKGTILTDLLDGSTSTTLSPQGNFVSETVDTAGTLKRYVALDDETAGGNDVLTGGDGDDFLHAGAGADLLSGGSDDDALFGDLGDDTCTGDSGDDHAYGGAGNDSLDGSAGADLLYGGDGDDWLVADQSGDRLIDWFGNFNNFVVPDSSYGAKVVLRSPAPAMQQFLLDLATADGALHPNDELLVVLPPSPSNSGKGGRTT
jgi:Ca2+-binding RTX toxin-like protein